MSEFSEYADRLNMREQLARIDRTQAEIHKFAAETQKMQFDMLKAQADMGKVQFDLLKTQAETAKVQVDTQLAPWQVFGVMVGAAAGFFLAGAGFLRLLQ